MKPAILARRRFLFASAGIVAASSLMPVSVKAMDFFDDTVELQRLINAGGNVDLKGRTFRVGRTIVIPDGVRIACGLIEATPAFPKWTPMLRVEWPDLEAAGVRFDMLDLDSRNADVILQSNCAPGTIGAHI